jgi:uncharacterized protein YecT (DUF1311 family)
MLGLFALVALTAAPEPPAGACQLRSNYDFLRDLAFTRASTQVPGHSADLARLKRAVKAEGVDVRSVSYDPETGRLECKMTLTLALPPSAEPYFRAQSVAAPVRYWAEPQDDGSGYSVITEGLAPIIGKIVAAAGRFPAAPDFGTAATPATLPAIASAEPVAPAAPEPRPLPAAGFDCALAATAVEHMICDSDALAEADRTMSKLYFAVRKDVHGAARQRLLDSQRKFLGRRGSCDDEACLVGLYMARAAELAH